MNNHDKSILAFGASSSRQSINKRFAKFAAHQVEHAKVDLLDLNDYEMPLYSIDREKENGIPSLAYDFKEKLKAADGIVISFAEHNGSYTVAFKNIFDWISRIDKNIWENKPMLLLSTSPGGRGGKGVMETALKSFKFMNTNTILGFSLPRFRTNFNDESGILDTELKDRFEEQLKLFEASLHTPQTSTLEK